MINWTVRFRNPAFLATFLPELATLITAVSYLFVIDWTDPLAVKEAVGAVVVAAIAVVGILGSINDPTVEGMSDSTRALSRQEPGPNVIAEMAKPAPEEERVDLEDVKRRYEGNHSDHFTGEGGDDGSIHE